MATAISVKATGNPEIDGLLSGSAWTGTITYSFPASSSVYVAGYGDGEPTAPGFSPAPVAMQQATAYAVALISSYTNAVIVFNGTGGADIAVAQSSSANPTSYAYYPGNYPEGGDVWFGTSYDYSGAALGNYFFATAIHELGHSFGLKHSQETGGVANVAVPAGHDDLEYSVMSYRSYLGGSVTSGYTNEAYGYPQTYMANDILALQTMYGANYNTHSENTVYSWSPTTGQEFINGVAQPAPGGGAGGSANRIFMTVWDGNGVDTYDLSNYTTPVSIDLNPGASSITSATQLAYLGNGHYAAGNVYNAYLYNGDARSYIDNAIGGSANDNLSGNAIANTLNGNGGNDTFIGNGGNDIIDGGSGADIAVFSGSKASYIITYNSATQTFTIVDQRIGTPDGTDTVTGVENFRFADGTFASSLFVGTPVSTVNHAPSDETISGGVIPENSPNGSVVGTVTGIDPDPGTVLTYSLLDDAGGRFLIDSKTGQLTVANSSLLDYEVATSHSIVVRATDQGGLFLDKGFTIQLTDVSGATINGTDPFWFSSGNDALTGTPEADTLKGLGGNDVLKGLGGNDTLVGGAGNDTIDGGQGIDVAVFSGNRTNYQVTYNSVAQSFTVKDQRAGSPDGTDTIVNVENFKFADGTFAALTLGGANVSGSGVSKSPGSEIPIHDEPFQQPFQHFSAIQSVLQDIFNGPSDTYAKIIDHIEADVSNWLAPYSQYHVL